MAGRRIARCLIKGTALCTVSIPAVLLLRIGACRIDTSDPDADSVVQTINALIGAVRVSAKLHRWDQSPENPDEVKLRLELVGCVMESASERGFFHALCNIRLQLENSGVLLECYGASRNVYPSAMIEAMGYGEKAYRLSPGKPAAMADLVSIFDSGADVDPVTVRQQAEYYEHWLESL